MIGTPIVETLNLTRLLTYSIIGSVTYDFLPHFISLSFFHHFFFSSVKLKTRMILYQFLPMYSEYRSHNYHNQNNNKLEVIFMKVE